LELGAKRKRGRRCKGGDQREDRIEEKEGLRLTRKPPSVEMNEV
jgi:hypothetical protein